MAEIWKEIPGFSDYEASNLGNIRSNKRGKKNHIMIQRENKFGYLRVSLYDNNYKRKFLMVHRLITLTFIGESNLTVNHKDGHKKNNKIENLEYCTLSENHRHAFRKGLKNNKGEKHPSSKNKEEDIILIRKLYNIYGIKQKFLSFLFNIPTANIHCIVKNKSWRHI
jgi:hypothetical protein